MVFSIKRFISLFSICIAALLLAGCNRNAPDMPPFTFQSDSSESQSSSDKPQSSEPPVSLPSSSESEPSAPVDTSEPSSLISVPEIGAQTLVLSNDPRNAKTLIISGTTAVITGRAPDSGLDFVWTTADAEVNEQKNGDEFTIEVELNSISNGIEGIMPVYKDRHSDEVYLRVGDNGFELLDLSDIVQNNKSVVDKAVEQPQNQVAEYIVKGGKPDEMRKVLEEIQALSDVICKGLDNDYDKLRAISRWVSANIYYDHPSYDRGVPAETLSLKYMLDKHSSVCGGYSNMTSALCAAQGIKCWNVHGSAITGSATFAETDRGEYHEWNYAVIDGRVVWVDSGWNSHCHLRHDGTYDDGGIGYRYFDIGEEYFAQDHKASYAEYRDYFAILS